MGVWEASLRDEETAWRCKELREVFRLFDLDDSHVITGDEASLPPGPSIDSLRIESERHVFVLDHGPGAGAS